MAKTLILEPIWGPLNFFHRFYLYQLLDNVPSYHFMEFLEKLINQTWENDKNVILDLILASLAQIWPKMYYTRYYTLLQAITICNLKEN